MTLKTQERPTQIRDLLEPDARVVCVEGFRPAPIGHDVPRGRFYKLTDEIVRQYPMYFAVLVPVDQVLGEIERGGE